ncbi:MAG: glutathione S-transferase family protein [Alphaproteobacteria bacterium]
MLRIWGRANSINVQKVVWAAAELEMPFERIDVGGVFGGLQDQSYGAKNPNRRIPVIEDGHVIVWESHAILRYLGAVYGADGLWPSDPVARAPVDMWLDWYHTESYVHLRDIFWQQIRTPAAERNRALLEQQRAALDPKLAIPDAQLRETAFIAGERFTVADIALGLLVHRWYRLDVARTAYPALERWYDDLSGRPAFAEYCAAPLT